MTYILEPDPMKAAHDGRCPLCGSADIQFERDLGIYPVNTMYEGKLCQRVKKSLWQRKRCYRLFASNKFIVTPHG